MYNIPVLTFHSVMDHDCNRPWSFLSTSVKTFENTLKYISGKGYKTISLQELHDLRIGKLQNDSKLVVIHFDDGFLDNYTIVYPLLKKYGFKATVFVSPEFVDPRPVKRGNAYEKIIKGEKVELQDCWGYMSWDELREIDESGVIDVQGHAMTHTRYPISSKIVNLHHKGDSYYWLWWNRYQDKKPFWLTQYRETDVPFGTPVFEYSKSLSGKRFLINPEVEDYILSRTVNFRYLNDKKNRRFLIDKLNCEIVEKFQDNTGREETDEEFRNRLFVELSESKRIIEDQLNKKVSFLAWPGGAKNQVSQAAARAAGYLSVTAKGKPYNEVEDDPYHIYRVGGWSGLRVFGRQSSLIERLFIWMQFHRSRGNQSLINNIFASVGSVYRAILLNKNKNSGECERA
jgi:peptidoglycan/xylan/chitin deacetylase (PgdA/CDA1 family)